MISFRAPVGKERHQGCARSVQAISKNRIEVKDILGDDGLLWENTSKLSRHRGLANDLCSESRIRLQSCCSLTVGVRTLRIGGWRIWSHLK